MESQTVDGILPLKFSANLTFLFPECENVQEKYDSAKSSGFNAVEWGNNIYDYPISDLVEINKKHKLKHILINMFTGTSKGLACLPGRCEEFKQCLELSIQYCKSLNCKRIHIMAGEYTENSDEPTDEIMDTYHQTFLANLRYASERLELENITILIEPISTIENYFLTSVKQAVDIIKEIGCTNIQLQLDLFHQQRLSGNLTETITSNFQYIGHIQVSQVPNRSEPNDDGEINYKYIFKLLQKLGYDQWIGCEYTPILAPYETFEWMKPFEKISVQGLANLQEMMHKAGM